jgi:endo-1,4-beta-D-glucanase Y
MARGGARNVAAGPVTLDRRCHAFGYCVAIALAGFATGCKAPRQVPPAHDLLLRTWETYKSAYIASDGYVVDRTRGEGETTSEGQGYALLRAAWVRDQATFAQVLGWSEQHLRRADGLYSWRYSPAAQKILDANTAADADQEIAFALVLGARVFANQSYLARARDILVAIRRQEAIRIKDAWFPAAGNWATSERIVNLSYFLPYAYPYFAQADPDAGWMRVIDIGYDLISNALEGPERKIVPDFMVVSSDGGFSALPAGSPLSGDFSSDAMRLYWRVAVDCRMRRSVRACADPLGAGTLARLLARDGAFFTRYTVGGVPLERTESLSFYGAALPYLLLYAPAAADAVRSEHLTESALGQVSTNAAHYYDANWVWFGLAAADGFIAARTPPVN